MASNLLSRLLPSNPAGRSIYDDLRAHDEASESDLEEQAGLALDEENLRFQDDELGIADVFSGEDSRITSGSTAYVNTRRQKLPHGVGNNVKGNPQGRRSKFFAQSPRLLEEDGDDDVPASLLIEDNELPHPSMQSQPRTRPPKTQKRQAPITGPSSRETRAHWEAAQAQQRLHQDEENISSAPQSIPQSTGLLSGNAREKAIWRWINTTNLDNFIREVYDYYTGAGMFCILLEKALNLA